MSRLTVSLKSRVRYEGRSHTMDHRADLEQLPDPVWYTAGQVLRQNYRKVVRGQKVGNPTPSAK